MSAYYSRNDSYSRSYRAECAESEGRYPRLRAAKHLGVSAKAFDAGRERAGYHTSEWHHVGKYAAAVNYYDTLVLAASPEFWHGASTTYSSAKKRAELQAKARSVFADSRDERIAEFREKLVRQRDCSWRAPYNRGPSAANWTLYCWTQFQARHIDWSHFLHTPKGNFGVLDATLSAAEEYIEHDRQRSARECHRLHCERVYDTQMAAVIEERSLSVRAFVPENHLGCSFPLLGSVEVVATATRDKFRRKMVDAKYAAAKGGYNAVIPANPTAHYHGNGWIPAIVRC